jgi:osmotically-inducible protein OsmY
MSKRDLHGKAEYEEKWNQQRWDRDHFERWMDTVRANQRDPGASYGTVGGTPYQGGVFSSATYGGGAEFYSVTGMYENPLLQKKTPHLSKTGKPYSAVDQRIHDEVCQRLNQHPLIDATLIDVRVDDGDVSLSGEVLDTRMKEMAEDITEEVFGVKEIHNNLRAVRERAA